MEQQEQSQNISEMAEIITHLWNLTCDRQIKPEEAESRAVSWLKVFEHTLFNKRLGYKIHIACLLRQHTGRPILADELYLISEMVETGYLWDGRFPSDKDDWVLAADRAQAIWHKDPAIRDEPFEQHKDRLIRQLYGEE